MHLFYQPNINNGSHFLDPDESRHCVKSLRQKENDKIQVTDGKGKLFTAKITKADIRKCTFEIISEEKKETENHHIHIAIAPTKSLDRIEWFIEKAVEIGIDEVSFILCQQSEKRFMKLERIKRKAISAMKQSLKYRLPKINALDDFEKFIKQDFGNTQKFIAYVDHRIPQHLKDTAKSNYQYLVLIGPEGDFSEKEITLAKEKGFTPISLGKNRLRTETAGIAACHILNLINET